MPPEIPRCSPPRPRPRKSPRPPRALALKARPRLGVLYPDWVGEAEGGVGG